MMGKKIYQIIRRFNGGYEIYRETETKCDIQSQLNALLSSGIYDLYIKEHIIEAEIKSFTFSLSPIKFNL